MAGRHPTLDPRLPNIQELSPCAGGDKIALGSNLAEQRATHCRSYPAGAAKLAERPERKRILRGACGELVLQLASADDEARRHPISALRGRRCVQQFEK